MFSSNSVLPQEHCSHIAAATSNGVCYPELVLSCNCGCPFKKRKRIEGKQESLEPEQGHWNNFLFKKIIVPLC